jgi:hypothetical protein
VLVCLDHVNSLVMWMPRNETLSTRSATAECYGAKVI